jgi:hypothetical protein
LILLWDAKITTNTSVCGVKRGSKNTTEETYDTQMARE